MLTLLATLALSVAGDPLPQSLALTTTAVVPGRAMTMTVTGLHPNELVYIVRSTRVQPAGMCIAPLGGDCLDLRAPAVLLTDGVADAAGTAELTLTVPTSVPVGAPVALQAVALRGLSGVASVASPALDLTTTAAACGDGVVDPGETCDDGNLVSGDGCDAVCVAELCAGPTVPVDSHHVDLPITLGRTMAMALGDDGTLYLGGSTSSVDPSMVVAAFDADLQPLWAHELPGRNDTVLRGLAPHPNGVYAVGTDQPGGYYQIDARTVSLDADGSLGWSRTYETGSWWDENIGGAIPTTDGVLAFGHLAFNPFYNDDNHVLAIHQGHAGQVLWSDSWDTQVYSDTLPHGAVQLVDGDVVVVGEVSVAAVLNRLSTTGSHVFGRRYIASFRTEFLDVTEAPNGDLLVSGSHEGSTSADSNAFLARLDGTDGDVIWARAVALPDGDDTGVAVAQTPASCDVVHGDTCATVGDQCAAVGELCACGADGSWTCSPGEPEYLLGIAAYTSAGRRAIVARFDGGGSLQGATQWGALSTRLHDVQVTDAGGVVLLASDNDPLIVRTDPLLTPVGSGAPVSLTTFPLGFSDSPSASGWGGEDGMNSHPATTVPGAAAATSTPVDVRDGTCLMP
jgi:cysteine-rich repeat protein